MRRYIVATILLLALAGTAHAATPSDAPASERRTALVIGNSDYELISPLRNPVNDARAIFRFQNVPSNVAVATVAGVKPA